MLWTEAKIYTTHAGIEPITGRLLLLGINGCAVQDSIDFMEFLEDDKVYWDYIEQDLMRLKDCETVMTFYIPQNTQGLETLLAVRDSLRELKQSDRECEYGTLAMETSDIDEQDWANNWKKYFKPFPVGKRLVVKPSWETLKQQDGKIVLELDPASAFGTGSHATTFLCLTALEDVLERTGPVENMLDVGCGSGILGIAAAKLGARHVTAIDIDENAVHIAAQNAAANLPEGVLDAFVSNLLTDSILVDTTAQRRYDIIAANIVADVLIAMGSRLTQLLCPTGTLIVSGILSSRKEEVAAALVQCGLIVQECREKDDWSAVLLCHDSL